MSYSKLFHDELGPLRPDLVDLSDYEDSDMDDDDDDDLLLNLQDDFILAGWAQQPAQCERVICRRGQANFREH
jgi:hypothetical protein